MPKQITYDEYYAAQMQFIDRYIRSDFQLTDTARLDRIRTLQSQQSIYFLDDFLQIEDGKELETTRIGYRPFKEKEYGSELVLAPDAKVIQRENRRLSRYRLVCEPVDFYLGSQLEEPTVIHVITACAPNLMGTSDADLEEFSTGEKKKRQLKVDQYDQECKKLADFIVSAAKNSGQDRLIMPAFGVGVYVAELAPTAKETARDIMYQAFAAAAAKYQININWIVWRGDAKHAEIAQTLENYSHNNKFMRPVIHDDMMLYAQERLKEEKVVLLNPGSDRTIGGLYTHRNPKTLEEQIAQQSDLLFLHSEFNKPMVEKFNNEFSQRKNMMQQAVAEKSQGNPQQWLDALAKAQEIIDQTVKVINELNVNFADKNTKEEVEAYRRELLEKTNNMTYVPALNEVNTPLGVQCHQYLRITEAVVKKQEQINQIAESRWGLFAKTESPKKDTSMECLSGASQNF